MRQSQLAHRGVALTGGAAFAQDTMMSGDHMTAFKSDMKKMDHCKSMDHDVMMKNRS